MKKFNRRHLYWLLQTLGWSAYGVLVFLASFNQKDFILSTVFLTNLIFSVFLGISLSHLLRNLIISQGLVKIVSIGVLIRAVLNILMVSFIYVGLSKIVTLLLSQFEIKFETISFLLNWASFFFLFGFWLALYYGVHFYEENQRQEIDNLALKAFQSELELQNLRTQLNPHFLFNALNSIRALVDLDPRKSKEAVTLLSNLLRFSLSTNYDILVSVEDELQMVDSYINLEKIRYEERLTVKKEINHNLKSISIPAFTIQTLVENAIKHGISMLIEGGEILIRIERDEKFILIQVANSGNISEEKDLGIGLSNLCKRLDIEYGENYIFSMYQADLVYVEIRIPSNR